MNTHFKRSLIAMSLASACTVAEAAEYGRVVSSTEVTAEVAVPQQDCYDQPTVVKPETSGGGAVLGAVVGGVVGNRFGAGSGRALATGVGAVVGAVAGNKVEAGSTPDEHTTVRNCQNAVSYERRVVGYDVVYDYNGRRYSTRLDHDPGDHIELAVSATPVGQTVTSTQPPPTVVYADPNPTVIYAAPPPVYYSYPYGYSSYGYGYPYGYGGYGGTSVVVGVRGGHYGHR